MAPGSSLSACTAQKNSIQLCSTLQFMFAYEPQNADVLLSDWCSEQSRMYVRASISLVDTPLLHPPCCHVPFPSPDLYLCSSSFFGKQSAPSHGALALKDKSKPSIKQQAQASDQRHINTKARTTASPQSTYVTDELNLFSTRPGAKCWVFGTRISCCCWIVKTGGTQYCFHSEVNPKQLKQPQHAN